MEGHTELGQVVGTAANLHYMAMPKILNIKTFPIREARLRVRQNRSINGRTAAADFRTAVLWLFGYAFGMDEKLIIDMHHEAGHAVVSYVLRWTRGC